MYGALEDRKSLYGFSGIVLSDTQFLQCCRARGFLIQTVDE